MQKEITFSSARQRKLFINKNPEYFSVENFAEFLTNSERKTFTGEEMLLLAGAHCQSFSIVREQLEQLGFTLEQRRIERRIRGYKSRDDDRWDGPGSSLTFGSSGFDNRE